MRHPSLPNLALFASGDLPLVARWRIRRHLFACSDCQNEVELFRETRQRMRSTVLANPHGIHWKRLAAEMTANIHVGLEAGECVEPRRAARVREVSERLGWKPALAFALMAAVVVAGWFLLPQHTRWQQADTHAVVLTTTPEGIEMKDADRALTMRHPQGENVVYTVNTEGEMRARFVDAETGQVTINHVYVD